MRGYILAAGIGSRLRPITSHVPKPLLPFGGFRLIEYAMHSMRDAGVQSISVNTHHLGSQIHDFLGDGSPWNMNIQLSHEPELLGTGGGLATMFVDDTEPCFVANADVITAINWNDVLATHRKYGAVATMVLRPNSQPDHFASIDVDPNGHVIKIGKNASGPWMFTGLQILEPRAVARLPVGRVACSVADMYRPLIADGEPVVAYFSDGYWADLGTPSRYLEEALRFLDGDPRGLPVAPYAAYTTPRPGIFVHGNTQISDKATLLAPMAIADGVHIGAESTVGPHVMIAQNAHIEHGAHISHAIILDHAIVHTGECVDRMIRIREA